MYHIILLYMFKYIKNYNTYLIKIIYRGVFHYIIPCDTLLYPLFLSSCEFFDDQEDQLVPVLSMS